MAAGYVGDATTPAYTGNIVNEGTINVTGKDSIGMYGVGSATTVYNGTSKRFNCNNKSFCRWCYGSISR